ncbi:glucosyltransferase domain-containing protein [Paucisalibacillus globulus]|uniref:glucosyltransferase domain-containing protein n=1 Tax=Paucisalibacillus globulus TaxID=351095 RepID=UPI0003FB55C4|nr:glucosyltransferase domain-containing protein [Paucisalibacillus globulus]
MPEDFLIKLNKLIKNEWKLAFFSAIIVGFITHMYVFTNMLPNHDGILNAYSEQLKRFASGRFFLSPVSGITSFFDLPWINGIFSILYLALTSVICTELFKLRKYLSIIIVSGLIVTFPTVGSTFSYMFTADAYMAGILLAGLSVLITNRTKFGFIPGGVILYISMGIYQANLPIVLCIVVSWFINEIIVNKTRLKSILLDLCRQIIMTAIGMGLYTITFKVYEKIGNVTSYQGIDQIGKQDGNVVEIFTKILDTAAHFFFRGLVTDAPINLFEILNSLLILLIILGIILAVYENKIYRAPFRIVLLLVSIILLPIFGYILYFVSPGVLYHMLMIMSLVFIYIIPVLIYDKLTLSNILVKPVAWGTVIILFLTIFNFAVISNISYFNMTLKYEKSFALANRVLNRMEQTEGYENVSKIVIVGKEVVHTKIGTEIIPNSIPSMTGATGEIFIVEPYHFTEMLSTRFGTTLKEVKDEQFEHLVRSDLIKQMDTWPSNDSIRIIDDIVIVKFSD